MRLLDRASAREETHDCDTLTLTVRCAALAVVVLDAFVVAASCPPVRVTEHELAAVEVADLASADNADEEEPCVTAIGLRVSAALADMLVA